MKTRLFIFLGMILLSLYSCQESAKSDKSTVDSKDMELLNTADSAIVSEMNVEEKLRMIKVYKLAEYIDLNLTDSIYTLLITKEEAEKLGVDENTYKETVTALEQVNNAIVEYNRHHGEGDTIVLTDFKLKVKR